MAPRSTPVYRNGQYVGQRATRSNPRSGIEAGRVYTPQEVARSVAREAIARGNANEPTRSPNGLRGLRSNVGAELARLGRSLEDYDAMRAEEQRDFAAGRATDDRTNAFKAYLRTGRASTALVESRDMGYGTNSGGGYLIPPGRYNAELLLSLQYHSALTAKSRKWETPTGSTAYLPLAMSDTSNSATALGENTQNSGTDLSLSRASFGECPTYIGGDLLRVSNLLLQDATYDVGGIVAQAFAQRVGAAVDAANMATLLANANIPTVTSAANTGIALADLEAALYTLDAVYRGSDSAAWIVSKATAKLIRAITDTNGRPIVEDVNMVIEQSDSSVFGEVVSRTMKVASFRGLPILESPNVADFAAGATYGVVASFEDAFITRVVTGSLAIQRLTERYADFNQTAYNGWARLDGAVYNYNAACILVAHA